MKAIVKLISKNQGTFAALAIMFGMMIWTYGCTGKVSSLTSPSKLVNREELNLEIATETKRLEGELEVLIGQAKIKNAELDRQDEIKQKIYEFASISAQTGTVNPSGLVGLMFSVLGIGAVIDNRIKDKVIKNRPLPVAEA